MATHHCLPLAGRVASGAVSNLLTHFCMSGVGCTEPVEPGRGSTRACWEHAQRRAQRSGRFSWG